MDNEDLHYCELGKERLAFVSLDGILKFWKLLATVRHIVNKNVKLANI